MRHLIEILTPLYEAKKKKKNEDNDETEEEKSRNQKKEAMKHIAVLSQYKAQCVSIEKELRASEITCAVNTVVGSQGNLYSPTSLLELI